MKRLATLLLAILAASLLCGAVMASEQTLTYADLVKRLISLEDLAVLPAPGERDALCSSYDRASKYDTATGKYIAWDANGDGGGIIRKEGNEQVFAEMEGPGCIWRTWSAAAQDGHVRIFIDGQEKPTVDLAFKDYFTGKTAPFAYPMLSYDLNESGSSGQNLYFPIPFQKSCKIVADPKWGAYYQFTYQTFPKGTVVPSFSAALVAENDAAIQKVCAFLSDKIGTDPAGVRRDEKTVTEKVALGAGETKHAVELAGPEAITAIRVKTAFKDREDQMAGLRRLAIAITWDGEAAPAVWSPLGDFFGTAPGENMYKSLPTGMTSDGYYAYWYMPFAKSARVDLINEDSVAREVQLEVVHAPLGRPFEGLGHFHAKWHRDTRPLPKDRFPDWLMLETQGRGRFCGVMLHVWNPAGGWWGEGDEKFFVDGEKFPSTIGTGSEDYFGYAWCRPELFERPFHGQNMTQGNQGHQCVFRWHISDNVPFQTGFEGCIEKYYTNEERLTLYACLPIWYLAPGGKDSYGPVPAVERHGYYAKTPFKIGDVTVLEAPAGNFSSQELKVTIAGKEQESTQLWWTDAKPGDKITFALDVEKDGKYRLSALLTKAKDYGIVQFYLDGEKIGDPVDLYSPKVVATDPALVLATRELKAGRHKVDVEITGANPKAEQSYLFGLHRFILEPTQ
jgi:hypothetical protein